MRSFLIRWLVTTAAVWVAVQVTGMQVEDSASLFVMALVLGVINAILRPVLLLLSLPFILVTLGLFALVVNALLFWFAGELVPGFHVGGFWHALFGSIIVSCVSSVLGGLFKGDAAPVRIAPTAGEIPPPAEKSVRGRVIGE